MKLQTISEIEKDSAADIRAALLASPDEMVAIGQDRSLAEAIEIFQANPALRLLPVIDPEQRPVGAIHEVDIRRILFNPFGHALLKNPSFGRCLSQHVRACPTVDADTGIAALLDIYGASGGSEGLILTRGGRLFGVVPNRTLVMLAAERERELAQARTVRLERIDRLSALFQREASGLAREVASLAGTVSEAAAGMSDRASNDGERAAAVAAAASQAALNMSEIASRGRGLATTLDRIQHDITVARTSRSGAVELVAQGSERTRSLAQSADEVGDVVTLIDGIARKVKLLALNATIEAARAGEAGHGFAIVAAEIKSLAGQTQAAAAGITRRIGAIRSAVADLSAGQSGMEAMIAEVDALSSSIETAVTEQGVTTRLIATNVGEAVVANDHIHRNADAINADVHATAGQANELSDMAGALADTVARLGNEVSRFVADIRAA